MKHWALAILIVAVILILYYEGETLIAGLVVVAAIVAYLWIRLGGDGDPLETGGKDPLIIQSTEDSPLPIPSSDQVHQAAKVLGLNPVIATAAGPVDKVKQNAEILQQRAAAAQEFQAKLAAVTSVNTSEVEAEHAQTKSNAQSMLDVLTSPQTRMIAETVISSAATLGLAETEANLVIAAVDAMAMAAALSEIYNGLGIVGGMVKTLVQTDISSPEEFMRNSDALIAEIRKLPNANSQIQNLCSRLSRIADNVALELGNIASLIVPGDPGFARVAIYGACKAAFASGPAGLVSVLNVLPAQARETLYSHSKTEALVEQALSAVIPSDDSFKGRLKHTSKLSAAIAVTFPVWILIPVIGPLVFITYPWILTGNAIATLGVSSATIQSVVEAARKNQKKFAEIASSVVPLSLFCAYMLSSQCNMTLGTTGTQVKSPPQGVMSAVAHS